MNNDNTPAIANSLHRIGVYDRAGAWVFDDDKKGLYAEPFVFGSSQMIDTAILTKGLELDRDYQYNITISASEMPMYDCVITREGEETCGGYIYRLDGGELTGWLCPATTKFFGEHPERIYVYVEKGERVYTPAPETDDDWEIIELGENTYSQVAPYVA